MDISKGGMALWIVLVMRFVIVFREVVWCFEKVRRRGRIMSCDVIVFWVGDVGEFDCVVFAMSADRDG